MKHTAEDIRKELDQGLRLLAPDSLLCLPPDERNALADGATELRRKLDDLERSFLTIGLLGGTGVGKSTLMNALAGSPIALASHRRPATDQVLIYRHEEAPPLPRLPLEEVPWKEITHKGEPLRQILLCDLPDFDSLIGAHRDRVLAFLQNLDLLVWVTTPEKYGDARFYEFLSLVPKARENFLFVLNKLDLLFSEGASQKGYEETARVVAAFRKHLGQHHLDDPPLYALSAEEAQRSGEVSVWNQFPWFKQQISQRRKAKEILSIKTGNLREEMEHLFSPLRKEAGMLEAGDRILEGLIRGLDQERPLWVQEGRGALEAWFGKGLFRDILSYRGDSPPLVGPGSGLLELVESIRGRLPADPDRDSLLPLLVPPEDIALVFQKRLAWVEDRLSRNLLQEGIPSPLRARLQEALHIPGRWENLRQDFLNASAFLLFDSPGPPLRMFKAVQHLAYSGILILLLFVLGGEKAWSEVLAGPSPSSLLRLLLSCVHTLFSSKGLAALGAYALLNLLLALRFYRLYRRTLGRSSRKRVESLQSSLLKVWEGCLDEVLKDLQNLRVEIRSRLSAVSGLRGG